MKSQGSFGLSTFFVNNFRSNQDTESRKEPLCWHWARESTDMQFDSPSSIHDLRRCDLTLTSEQPWLWALPNKEFSIRRGLVRELWRCLNFGSIATFGRVMSHKPNLDPWVWVKDLTSEVTGWSETILSPSAASHNGRHAYFLRCSSSFRGETARTYHPLDPLAPPGRYVEKHLARVKSRYAAMSGQHIMAWYCMICSL